MDFHLPQLGEGVYEAEVIRWLVAAGDVVQHGQGLMEVMTDKATMEVPSPFVGAVTELRVQARGHREGRRPDPVVQPGRARGRGTRPAAAAGHPPPGRARSGHTDVRISTNGHPTDGDDEPVPVGGPVKASPSVRMLARKLGIDLRTVHGTGPSGRILVEDLNLPAAGAAGTAVQHVPVAVAARLDYGTPARS